MSVNGTVTTHVEGHLQSMGLNTFLFQWSPMFLFLLGFSFSIIWLKVLEVKVSAILTWLRWQRRIWWLEWWCFCLWPIVSWISQDVPYSGGPGQSPEVKPAGYKPDVVNMWHWNTAYGLLKMKYIFGEPGLHPFSSTALLLAIF